MSSNKIVLSLFVFLLLVGVGFADNYKPYLHSAKVPETPKVRMFGQYNTNLFPGSATYNYPIDVPKGVNGLSPSVFVSYNSQGAKGRPGILGSGWSLNQDLIYRDANGTPDDVSDDKYLMILDGNQYELIYFNGAYHTEVDYWFKIIKNSANWTVTKQDGKKYTFAYVLDSSRGYTSKWLLSLVEDTNSNSINYTYLLNPYAEDSSAVYLDNIKYNSDQKRVVSFVYESSVRPDRRRVYDQGNLFEESRRLTDITITVDSALVRRNHFTYTSLTPSLSSLSKITLYGNDNVSSLFSINFDYYVSSEGYSNSTSWTPVGVFSDATNDYGFQLLDLNNDGFIDVVQNNASNNNSWINNKSNGWSLDSSWNLPVAIISSNIDLGVRFADVNRDGYTDLLKSNSSSRIVYLNTGSGWSLSSWSIPLDFVNSSGFDQGVQLSDVNGDGRIDLIQAKSGNRSVYLNTGSGWSLSVWSVPDDFVTTIDTGLRLVDINGDGLPDLLKGNSSLKAWLNNGSGFVNYDSTWAPPISFVNSSGGDLGVRFVDVNGDGLVDILNQSNAAYLNTGFGWSLNNSWKSPEDFIVGGKNIGRRLADVDGDGFVDIMISYNVSNYTWTKNSTLPYMLKSITNEYGGVTFINYTKSTQYSNINLGFNIFVVNNVLKNNSLTSDFNIVAFTNYNYSLGKYNYDKSEFRGFGISTEIDNDSVTKHYFMQDDARRGKEYQTEIYNFNNNLFFKNTKDYNYTYSNGIYNLSLKSSTDYVYDGNLIPKIHNISYSYNLFGNPQFVMDFGDADVVGDEKYYNYSYGFNFDAWIINKVSRVTAYDSNFNKVKETKYYYDNLGLNGVGSKGELTKTEQWLESGNDTYNYFNYDSFGNLISKTDSLGNIYKYKYDKLNIFVESTVDPLGHVSTFSYDAGTGNLLSSTSNGITTYYTYDTFGRILKEIKPYDSTFLPTKTYVYSFDGVAPEKITVKQKTTANDTDNTNFFYDGFGNIVQIKQEIENGQEVVKNIFYDSKFRVGSEQNPYFANYNSGLTSKSSTDNITIYNYDSLSRVVLVKNTDGSNKTVSFNQYNITDYDENGHRHIYSIDAYGRITRVYEYNKDPYTQIDETYTTSYQYDSNDNLIKITDNENNVFQFFYDALGRKIKMIDPDMGTWTYQYDANNNLISQTDNKNSTITESYDSLNRIKSKLSSKVNTSFDYDQQFYGTLSNVTIGNRTFAYTYDDRLRISKITENTFGYPIVQNFEYDSQDKLVTNKGYSKLDYIFNKQEFVRKIPNYITDTSFNAFGSISSRGYSNGLTMNFAYNPQNNRLTTISVPSVMNFGYQYDSIGNIVQINDSLTPKLYRMSYDSLDRLVNATIGTDTYTYSYNSIGNMQKILKNNESKKLVYSGLAHAPSKIIEGGASVDLQNPHELSTNSKDRVFEFYLINEKNSTITANFSTNFGDGSPTFTSNNMNITDSVIVLVEQNYSHGGDYSVNFTASANGLSDYETKDIKFGTNAEALDILYSDITRRMFELIIGNDVKEQANNINWNCSENIYSFMTMNLSGNSSSSDLIDYYYSSPGKKTFQCNVTSLDGNDSISKDLTIRGLEVEDYDVLYSNISRYVMAFTAKNYYNNLSTNIKISTNNETFNNSFNISSNEDIIVITEINYSSDGQKDYEIDFTSNDTSSSHIERFLIAGISIENYVRLENNYTSQVLMFDVKNNWKSGNISWNLTNPDVNVTIDVNNGDSVAVIIENSYNVSGNNKAEIRAKASSYVDTMTDFFTVLPLQISSFEALTGNVFEIVARNHLNSSQVFNWQLDSINSTNSINITSDDAFIIVEQNTSSGIYVSTARINSSQYADTENELVIS